LLLCTRIRERGMGIIKEGRNNWKIFVILLLVIVFLSLSQSFSGETGELKRVVVIVTMPVPACEAHLKWFVTQLNDLGYEDGKNINLTVIRANGDRQFAEDELRRVVKTGEPDVVATIATLASQAALNVLKGTKVPIFFFQVSDPVGAGLIKKIGEPTGTNVSGRIFTVPREIRIGLVMRLIGQTVPKNRAIRFGYIHSTYLSAIGGLQELKTIENIRNDIRFESSPVMYKKVPEGVPTMLTAAKSGIHAISDKVDFWWEPQGPLGELHEYTQLLLDNSTIPIAMGQTLESVKMGALLHITPDLEASGREAAKFVNALLKGTDPGEIPVVPPTKFQFGINLTTALKLNIVVPPDILDLAGDHVYR
jgi:putative tryptophan/tyrosine transport system substrate-binding protein